MQTLEYRSVGWQKQWFFLFFLHESTKNVGLISQWEIEQQALSILYMFIVYLPCKGNNHDNISRLKWMRRTFMRAEDPGSHLRLLNKSGNSTCTLLPQKYPFHPQNNPFELQDKGTWKFVSLVYVNCIEVFIVERVK